MKNRGYSDSNAACVMNVLLGVVSVTSLPAIASAQTAVFSRPTDTISIPGTSAFSTAATYEAWVRSVEDTARVWNEWTWGEMDTGLWIQASGSFAYAYPIRRPTPLVFGVIGDPAAWHHVAYTYDGAVERGYIDGVLTASRQSSGTVGNSTSPVGVVGGIFRDGAQQGTGAFEIDALRISNIARYTAATFVPPSRELPSDANTRLLYDFNDCAGAATVTDRGPLARHGTLGVGFTGATRPRLGGAIAPVTAVVCPSGSAVFSEPPPETGGASYSWQIETSPGTWQELPAGPFVLPCGASVTASDPLSHQTSIAITSCSENDGPRSYTIRCVVTNACGVMTDHTATYSMCPADTNCDGFLDFFDYSDFTDAFENGDAAGDYNRDGFIDFFDYDDFVAAFEVGC